MALMIPLLASSVTRNLAVSLGVRNHQSPRSECRLAQLVTLHSPNLSTFYPPITAQRLALCGCGSEYLIHDLVLVWEEIFDTARVLIARITPKAPVSVVGRLAVA